MRRKIHLKKRLFKRKKVSKFTFIVILIFMFFVCIGLVLNFINKKVSPVLLNIAGIEINKLASMVVGKTLNEEVISKMVTDDLFIITKDSEGKIQTIDYNSLVVNKILLDSLIAMRTNLKYLSEGEADKLSSSTLKELYEKYDIKKINKGIFYEVPIGAYFNNPFLSNLGPKIPVRFKLVGDISNNLSTQIKEFGINNAMIETFFIVKLRFDVILPISLLNKEVEFKIPLSIKFIQSEIPNYYFNGFKENSTILSLPTE